VAGERPAGWAQFPRASCILIYILSILPEARRAEILALDREGWISAKTREIPGQESSKRRLKEQNVAITRA
jgi:hypothetical protein